jgi:hypothetical protein
MDAVDALGAVNILQVWLIPMASCSYVAIVKSTRCARCWSFSMHIKFQDCVAHLRI